MAGESAVKTQAVPWRTPFFYGWVIVGVSVLVTFIQSAMSNPMLSLFVKPMGDEFGWSRGTISIATTIGSLLGGPLGLLIGPVLDRRGARVVLVAGAGIIGVAIFGLAVASTLWQFYLFYTIGRMIFMGATTMAVGVAVSNWFIRRRGRALGVAYMGDRVGGVVLPLLTMLIIASYGWRWAWVVLGVIVWSLAIIPALLLMRRRPEDVGLRPDGGLSPEMLPASETPAAPEATFTLREAMGTPTFWLIASASAMFFMVVGAANLHQFPHMLDMGVPPALAVGALSAISLFAGVGTITWGFLVDRIGPRLCLTINFSIAALSMVLLLLMRDTVTAYAYAVVYGFTLGGGTPLLSVAWANYYGRGALARIRGATTLSNQAFNAVGPAIAGVLFDLTRSYTIPFILLVVAYVLAAVLSLLARRPVSPMRRA
ncbi:MAG: MFS transporter [Chloroflexi bacterium]|nr:MFS transporter [Chloroflexota bacterium]